MQKKIKIWHIIAAISVSIIIIRHALILNTSIMLGNLVLLFFYDKTAALDQLNYNVIDSLFSITIIIIPFIAIWLRRKIIFNLKVDFASAVIIFLVFCFLYAPLISNYNPDFQKDLAVTKLLPPFSAKKILHLKEQTNSKTPAEEYYYVKDKVVSKIFNQDIIIADSIGITNSDNIFYFQGSQQYLISKNKLLADSRGRPFITENYYLLGTDELGRDIYSRLIYGVRVSIFVGLGSVLVSFILGISLGFIAGYSGGIINAVFNRISEMFLVFPVLFIIILILALFGNSLISVMVVLGFSGWMGLFKIVRGEVVSIINKDFFVTAQLLGLSKKDLLLKEVLPVILAPVSVNLVFQFGSVILAEAALSYLGLGTGEAYPSWGSMIEAGQNYLSQAWWMIITPGILLTLTLYSANSIGKKIQNYTKLRIN